MCHLLVCRTLLAWARECHGASNLDSRFAENGCAAIMEPSGLTGAAAWAAA